MMSKEAMIHAAPGGAPLTGWRRSLDRVYGWLMAGFVVAVLVQVFLAGVGVFGDHTAAGVAHASSFDPHRTLGSVLGVVAVALFLVALAVRASKSTVIVAFLLGTATMAAQPALAGSGDHHRWVGGLHAFDGLLILLASIWLAVSARRRMVNDAG